MKKIKFCLVLILLVLPFKAFCWDSTGHKVIAQIAYDHLRSAAKVKVDQLTQLLDPNYPPYSRFLFSSAWADQLREDDVTAFNAWHFIDYPWNSSTMTPAVPEGENVVWAINQSEHVLQSAKANNYEKAVFLRFLIHFVGDAHQPLHCTDRSGNLFSIRDPNVQNLHAYWDEGLGLFRQYSQQYPLSNKQVGFLANKIEQDYSENSFGAKARNINPIDWTQQSFQLAKNFAYNLQENTRPSAAYKQQGQKIVEQQLALAGYRLANLLNQIFMSS